jgi:long-chain acyl-CoA synthetase
MYPGERASHAPDKVAFVMAESGNIVTFGQYEAAANRFAHLVRDHGLRRLDHIALLMDNRPSFLACQGGAERTGLYYTCVNSHLTADEAAYIINDCLARIVVTCPSLHDVAVQLPERCPAVERWLMVDEPAEHQRFELYDDVVACYPTRPVDDERLGAVMLYSSGTTGRPKGILRPVSDIDPRTALATMTTASVDVFRQRPGMVYLSPAPLYHSAPQAGVSGAVRLGATSVIMERFDASRFLELIGRYEVTHTQTVPTMFSRLLKLPEEVRHSAQHSSLEVVVHGAAPCPIPVKEQMIAWWGPIIYEYYSSTEANGTTYCDSVEWLAHPGTVGKPIVGELVILDDHGVEVPTGTPGTIWFRGASSFEYFNDPAKTSESRDEGGTASTVGDVGYVDPEGYVYLTDRKAHMIISGGVNIYPQETENLLITHSKVMDAAVIGVPNEDMGQEVKAVVQLMPGVDPSPAVAAELIAFCRQHLARFKCPRTVDFDPELPRLATGKLYKRLLQDRYQERMTPNS